MDYPDYEEFQYVTFVVLMCIMALIILAQFCVDYTADKQSDKDNADLTNSLVKSFNTTLDLYSNIFFWFLFGMTGYWFLFFKFQERVFCFIPALDIMNKSVIY